MKETRCSCCWQHKDIHPMKWKIAGFTCLHLKLASMSMPLSSSDTYESLPPLVGHTGPLRSARRVPPSQMSGPLYISHSKPERMSKPNPALFGRRVKEPQEQMLLENLPEDVQIDLRRHLFKFVKKVRIFALMGDFVSDAIYEKLRQKTCIAGSRILYRDGLLDKMIFIVRGKILSIGEDGETSLSEGDICGEELLAWCLESSSVNKDGRKMRAAVNRWRSIRTVRCLTNVEAFALRAEDLEEVTSLYSRYLRNPRVQGEIRCRHFGEDERRQSFKWLGGTGRSVSIAQIPLDRIQP